MSTLKNTTIIVTVVVFTTFLLAAGPVSTELDNQNVFAIKNKKSNDSLQDTGQNDTTGQ